MTKRGAYVTHRLKRNRVEVVFPQLDEIITSVAEEVLRSIRERAATGEPAAPAACRTCVHCGGHLCSVEGHEACPIVAH